MSIPLTINGAVFEYPVNFDENWGVDATGWAQAVTNGMLQMSGGSFPITADINFGPNFGLLSKYFETRSSFPATVGTIRLSPVDAGIAWRNFAHSGNNILTTDASDNLQYNGSTISGGVNAGTQYKLGYYATTSSNISPNPNTMAATQVLVTDANGVPTTTGNGATTATEIGYVHNVTSAIQTQIDGKLSLTGGTMSGNIAMGSNKLTGLSAGSANGDSIRYEQNQYRQPAVQATTTTAVTTTSGTFQSTNLTASITPTSASSRIKITVTGAGSVSTSGANAFFTIFRGVTNLGSANGFCSILSPAAAVAKSPIAITYIDSPATTSSTTYTVKINNDGGATTSFPTSSSETCIIVLEELI